MTTLATTVNGVTTAYLYDGVNAVQETQGGVVNPILTGLAVDERFARNEGGTRSYFLTDALGSTVALANAGGSLIQQYQYDPYGNVTSTASTTNPYQYTGRENDGTGLDYYRARYYSPAMGRFISEDPLGFGGGQNNFYAYVGGNPLIHVDPLGLSSSGRPPPIGPFSSLEPPLNSTPGESWTPAGCMAKYQSDMGFNTEIQGSQLDECVNSTPATEDPNGPATCRLSVSANWWAADYVAGQQRDRCLESCK